jgi:Ca2+-binding EF-hand superfamily protein
MIMCDGNLAMANRFVDMSENDMNELHDWEEFKIFAKLHPHEAYELRPDDFCNFLRSEGFDLTNEEIKRLIYE